MHSLYGAWIGLQARTAWTSAGVFLVALVICCLVMMFTMRRGMGGRSRNHNDVDKRPDNDKSEQTGTKGP